MVATVLPINIRFGRGFIHKLLGSCHLNQNKKKQNPKNLHLSFKVDEFVCLVFSSTSVFLFISIATTKTSTN